MNNKIRKRFSDQLAGVGIDIGALHRPMVKHDDMQVVYVDKLPVSELRKHYPELKDFNLVEPDVISDAETLSNFIDGSLSFVIASHVIEHMRNPILAIKNWLRVLKPGGLLYLVVPDYRKIFDKHRELTTLSHVIADYELGNRNAQDIEHYYEYATLVNKKFFGRDIDEQEEAIKLMEQDYSIHFHTFTPESFKNVLLFVNEDVQRHELIDSHAQEDDIEFHYLVRKNRADK